MYMSYASVQQFKNLALPSDAIEELNDCQITEFLEAAAGVIDGYLSSRYTVPALGNSQFLLRCNIDLAACDALAYRGYNPEQGDEVYKERCEMWHRKLEDVRKGVIDVPGIDSTDPNANREGRAQSRSKKPRGIYNCGGGVGII
jgi:phage gp36-like protein